MGSRDVLVSDGPELGDLGPAVLGTMTFGDQTDEAAARRMIEIAREAGVRMFDTANTYNAGRSEEMLGRIVAPFRDDVLIASKVGNRGSDGASAPSGQLRPDAIRLEVEGSLRRLGTDRLDLYYLHRPDWSTPMEETLGACEELVRSGKIRAVGLSNYAAWQFMEALALARTNDWSRIIYSQPMYNILARRPDEEYGKFSAQHGIRNIVFNPLAGGLLTGKHRLAEGPSAETRFALRASYRDRYWTKEYFDAVNRLDRIAADAAISLVALALRWLDAQPLVHRVLLGASTVQQLTENLRALVGPAPDAETLRRCDEVWQSLRGVAPAYNK
jgi:aryl-alcohol dehydrogenase-like predicted oxidoreductase